MIWLGSRRITSPKMENANNSFKIDVTRPINLPFIQWEMTLWWISDETTRWTGKNAIIGFLADDHDLRDTIEKVGRREIWYRTTESVKRQPFMTYVSQISKMFMNQKCHQTCVQYLIKKINFVRDLKTAFLKVNLPIYSGAFLWRFPQCFNNDVTAPWNPPSYFPQF